MYSVFDKLGAVKKYFKNGINSNENAYNSPPMAISPNPPDLQVIANNPVTTATALNVSNSTNLLKQQTIFQTPSSMIKGSTSTLSSSRDFNHQLPSSATTTTTINSNVNNYVNSSTVSLGASTMLNGTYPIAPAAAVAMTPATAAAMVTNMGLPPSSLNAVVENVVAVPSQVSEVPIVVNPLPSYSSSDLAGVMVAAAVPAPVPVPSIPVVMSGLPTTIPIGPNPLKLTTQQAFTNTNVIPSPNLNLPTLASALAVPPTSLKQTTTLNNTYAQSPTSQQVDADHLFPSSIVTTNASIPSPSPFKLTSPIMTSQTQETERDMIGSNAHEIEMKEFMSTTSPDKSISTTGVVGAGSIGMAASPSTSPILDGASVSISMAETKTLTNSKLKRKQRKEKMKKFKKSVYQILAPSNPLPKHPVDSQEMERFVVPFIMEMGRALLMSGVPVHRLEFELTLLSLSFGLDGNFFSTPTGLFFSFGEPNTILSPYTHLLRIQSTDYNMERLVKLEKLADQIIQGTIRCEEGLHRLSEILSSPPLYNMYIMVFSFVVASFSIAFFFSAGWVEIGGMSIVGLYVGLLYAAAGRWPTIGRVLEALSAFGGSIIAAFFNSYIYPVHIFLVVLGGIISLAPGLTLTVAVAEISTRNLVSGNSRLMSAFSCILQLSFGIALGTRLSSNILPIREEVPPNSFPEWSMFLAIPLAAISFAIQMKVHPRQIWIIMITSVLGVVGGNWGNKLFGEDVGSFFGACLICIVSNLYARFTNGQSVVPILSGIILLVPGSMGVKGLFSMSSGDIESGVALLGGMFMISASLAIGLLVANLIIPPYKAL